MTNTTLVQTLRPQAPRALSWMVMGMLRASLGRFLGGLGRVLGALGRLLAASWPLLGRSWASSVWFRAPLGCICASKDAPDLYFKRFGDLPRWVFAHPGDIFRMLASAPRMSRSMEESLAAAGQ